MPAEVTGQKSSFIIMSALFDSSVCKAWYVLTFSRIVHIIIGDNSNPRSLVGVMLAPWRNSVLRYVRLCNFSSVCGQQGIDLGVITLSQVTNIATSWVPEKIYNSKDALGREPSLEGQVIVVTGCCGCCSIASRQHYTCTGWQSHSDDMEHDSAVPNLVD